MKSKFKKGDYIKIIEKGVTIICEIIKVNKKSLRLQLIFSSDANDKEWIWNKGTLPNKDIHKLEVFKKITKSEARLYVL